ncbi:gamma-glutamyl hydrolase-like [Belonocnema kinseyi]|uniref:gamma-glutamyl hydrolase-like n=1 Tax=Belonocnema kinseyi TaxID=2817044 RepID=UPI00143D4629|nr:gamma-glutamyl hydrolase-like [Belonocnema kinseyi]
MSLNHDLNGLEFISSIEHTIYPFYGVQFHPEKNIYEWIKGIKIPHGKNCSKVSQFFADFFVDEARKNLHKYESENEELESLIYNYPATYTGLNKSTFVQCYMFKKNV